MTLQGTDPSSEHLRRTVPSAAHLTADGPFTNADPYAPLMVALPSGVTYLVPGATLEATPQGWRISVRGWSREHLDPHLTQARPPWSHLITAGRGG